jgi:hypothetical protein
MKDLMRTFQTLWWAALIAAIYQELRKPPAERTWHGKVGGVVPYDFRIPTVERVKAAYWDPSSDRIFSDRVFGVGWAVNILVLIRTLQHAAEQYATVSQQVRDEVSRYVPQMSRRPGDGRPPES